MRTGQLLFALLFGSIAIFCFGYAIRILLGYSNLKKNGITTLGKIIDIREDPEGENIVVTYCDRIGKSFSITSKTGGRGYKPLIGKEVEVLYNPADPTKARIVIDAFEQTLILLVIGFLLGAMAIIMAMG
jgi:hypothetical protein